MFGPKQCSEFEELSTSTAEDVLYSLCFRSAGSGAKQCSYFEGKIASQNYAQAQPQKYCIFCVSGVKAQVRSSSVVSNER